MKPLNIFYKEPDPDRWLPYDRYLRRIVRRLVRGKQRPGGVMMVARELMRGLDKINVPYRFNDFNYIDKNPDELACIIGKPQLLFDRKWKNPILFGAGVFSHPIDCPNLFIDYPNVRKILVPGEWMRKMCESYYGNNVLAWPVGIDTEKWSSDLKKEIKIDFLIYDKVRWDYSHYKTSLIDPIKDMLTTQGLTYEVLRYGHYNHDDLIQSIGKVRAAIFLCEHETQGLAYQQILATGTPILAWDRGGYWQDPSYYPNKVKYEPVSSVPYWNDQCGIRFRGADDFEDQLINFLSSLRSNQFAPRKFIVENLSLEVCAKKYYEIVKSITNQI